MLHVKHSLLPAFSAFDNALISNNPHPHHIKTLLSTLWSHPKIYVARTHLRILSSLIFTCLFNLPDCALSATWVMHALGTKSCSTWTEDPDEFDDEIIAANTTLIDLVYERWVIEYLTYDVFECLDYNMFEKKSWDESVFKFLAYMYLSYDHADTSPQPLLETALRAMVQSARPNLGMKKSEVFLANWDVFLYLVNKVGPQMDQKQATKNVVDGELHVLQKRMAEVQRHMGVWPHAREVVTQYLNLKAKRRRGWK
jgi:hypothetical protein